MIASKLKTIERINGEKKPNITCPTLSCLKSESHSSTGSTGSPAHSNHEEEEEDETPTANFIKTLSCIRLGKHKGKLKQNVTVSH